MEDKREKKIPLVESFGPTIQGEGYMVGYRTSFLRFGLCDYKCVMCDSMHAVDPNQVRANAEYLTAEEIANRLLAIHDPENSGTLNADWVTFSGGNPCIHNLRELILRIRGFNITHGNLKIAVETQGTFCPDWLQMCDVVTVSPKSPGMGEQFEPKKFVDFCLQMINHIGFNIKVVCFDMQDFEFLKMINDMVIDIAPHLGDRMYASLGNPFPPGKDTDLADDADLKLRLLQEYRLMTEDLLLIPSLKNVKFLPQLHVLAWANKQAV